MEYLNNWIDTIKYFHETVDYFVDRGYVRDKSIRGAPYDWRLAPGEKSFSSQLKNECSTKLNQFECFFYYACMRKWHVHVV